MGTYDTLNDVLVNLFRDINSIEEKAITSQEYKDLTNNDMHVINAIGVGTTKNNVIYCKGIVSDGWYTDNFHEQPCEKRLCDSLPQYAGSPGGSIFLFRKKGYKAYYHHKHFHEQMIQGVVEVLTEEELQALIKALTKLNSWFRSFGKDE